MVIDGVCDSTTDHPEEAGIVLIDLDPEWPDVDGAVEFGPGKADAGLREEMRLRENRHVDRKVTEVVSHEKWHRDEREIVIDADLEIHASRPVLVDVVAASATPGEPVEVVLSEEADSGLYGEPTRGGRVRRYRRFRGCCVRGE